MRNFLTILFVVICSFCFSQKLKFSLQDSLLSENSEYTVPIYFNNFEPHMEHLLESHKPLLDSIVRFLSSHLDYEFEVGGHTTFRGVDEFNLKMSEAQAKSFINTLIINGAKKNQLQFKGYGETKLVNTYEEIDKLKTEKEKKKAHAENGRITIKVLKKKI